MSKSLTIDVVMKSRQQRGSCLWRSSWTHYLLMTASAPWTCHLTSVMWTVVVTTNCTRYRIPSFSERRPQWPIAYKLQKSCVDYILIVSIGVNLQSIWCSDGAVLLVFKMGWQFVISDGTMRPVRKEWVHKNLLPRDNVGRVSYGKWQ